MDKEERHAGFFIKVIHTTLDRYLNHYLKDLGLTKPQMDVLIYLHRSNGHGCPVSQKDLETYFHISNPSVSSMLDRLESKGLIRREPEPCDRRMRRIVATDKAELLTSEMHEIRRYAEKVMFQGMDKEQIDQGMLFLQTILQNLSRKEDLCFDQNTDEADRRI